MYLLHRSVYGRGKWCKLPISSWLQRLYFCIGSLSHLNDLLLAAKFRHQFFTSPLNLTQKNFVLFPVSSSFALLVGIGKLFTELSYSITHNMFSFHHFWYTIITHHTTPFVLIIVMFVLASFCNFFSCSNVINLLCLVNEQAQGSKAMLTHAVSFRQCYFTRTVFDSLPLDATMNWQNHYRLT